MGMNGVELVKRYDCLVGEASNHRAHCEAMAPFIAPSRVGILSQRSPGEKQTRNVFDSTTMMAAELMAHFIAGHVINPGQQWLGYRLRNPEIGRRDSVREWMEECRERTLRRASASMFYAEGPESLIDYGGFGTGFLLAEELPQPVHETKRGFRGFFFHAEKTGRFVIADGADGLVDTAMREFTMTARVAADQWPVMPENIHQALESGKIDAPFKFIHAILPRPKSDQTAGARGMPWASIWVEKESKTIVHEGGYQVFPAAVPRYHRTPGEVYGRGRGDLAFPDAWTLNTAKRMGLEDWALKIRPPILTAHDSVIGTLRLVPAGPTSVNTHGRPMRDVIMPFETGSNPQISMLKEEELRRSIREIFFVDTIRQLLETSKSEMTAFEYAKKLELLFRLLGPVYGRMEWEFLHRIVDIMFSLQLAGGDFSPPPPDVYESDGEIEIEFQNPIARAQRAGDVEAITLAVNDMAPLGQLFPQMWDGFDPDKTRELIFSVRGVPARVSRNEDEIAMVREERAKQDQQALVMQNVQGASEAMKNVAPIMKALQPQPKQGQAA